MCRVRRRRQTGARSRASRTSAGRVRGAAPKACAAAAAGRARPSGNGEPCSRNASPTRTQATTEAGSLPQAAAAPIRDDLGGAPAPGDRVPAGPLSADAGNPACRTPGRSEPSSPSAEKMRVAIPVLSMYFPRTGSTPTTSVLKSRTAPRPDGRDGTGASGDRLRRRPGCAPPGQRRRKWSRHSCWGIIARLPSAMVARLLSAPWLPDFSHPSSLRLAQLRPQPTDTGYGTADGLRGQRRGLPARPVPRPRPPADSPDDLGASVTVVCPIGVAILGRP